MKTVVHTDIWKTTLNGDKKKGGIGKSIPDARVLVEYGHSLIILTSSIFLQAADQEILPCGHKRIGSVEINPSLLMMRESTIYVQFPHKLKKMIQICVGLNWQPPG